SAQPMAECHGVIPGHVLARPFFTLKPARLRVGIRQPPFMSARRELPPAQVGIAHRIVEKALILLIRDRELADLETIDINLTPYRLAILTHFFNHGHTRRNLAPLKQWQRKIGRRSGVGRYDPVRQDGYAVCSRILTAELRQTVRVIIRVVLLKGAKGLTAKRAGTFIVDQFSNLAIF